MRTIICLSLTIATLCCTAQEKNLPKEFDFGKTENGVYANDFFELEVTFDPAWTVQDEDQMKHLVDVGTNAVSGDDSIIKATVEAAMVNTAYLFTAFKHEVGAPVEFNPSFMIIAENTKNAPGIKTGEDYLYHTKKLLKSSAMEYYFEKEVSSKMIGSSEFHVLEAKIDYMGVTITQDYFSTVTNGFCLSFVVSYTNKSEKKELYEFVKNIEM